MGLTERALAEVLDAAVAGRFDLDPPDPVLGALLALLAGEWDRAAALLAATAATTGPGAELRAALAVWVGSADPGPGSAVVLAAVDDLPDVAHPVGRVAGYLLVEGALAHARLDLAQRVAERLGEDLWRAPLVAGAAAFDPVVQACRARLLAFRGEVAAAEAVLARVPAPAAGRTAALLAATSCLVLGNALRPGDVRRLVAVVDREVPRAEDHLASGSHMLAAFGLIAVGDVDEAARRVLVAGGDEGLARLNVVDRALGLEMLTALAVAHDDLDAAEAWWQQAAPLLASPIADSTACRTASRVALQAGRVEEAIAWAEQAVARARAAERSVETAEGEILLNRARLQRTDAGPGHRAAAVRDLQRAVAEAERTGHVAVRRAAARELRPLGRRLRPHSGTGWDGLTPREVEVAGLVVAGASNRAVAERLHLSEHTVRVHVSRVLAAFGVATRSALPAVAAAVEGTVEGTGARPGERPGLTPRQQQVAALVGRGLSNAAIATELGITPRTVEKHLGDIRARWGLAGRTAVAHAVVALAAE